MFQEDTPDFGQTWLFLMHPGVFGGEDQFTFGPLKDSAGEFHHTIGFGIRGQVPEPVLEGN